MMTDEAPSPLSVLVVEDQRAAADATAEMLRLHGHRVRIARTAGAALELAADEPPDVALLDIGLPDLNGWQVARGMRDQAAGTGRRPLLIAVTGRRSDADRGRSAAAGIDLHLVKPVEPAVLVGILKRFGRLLARGPSVTPGVRNDPAAP